MQPDSVFTELPSRFYPTSLCFFHFSVPLIHTFLIHTPYPETSEPVVVGLNKHNLNTWFMTTALVFILADHGPLVLGHTGLT